MTCQMSKGEFETHMMLNCRVFDSHASMVHVCGCGNLCICGPTLWHNVKRVMCIVYIYK